MNDLIIKAIAAFLAHYKIEQGLTQEQHTALVIHIISETVLELTPELSNKLYATLYPLMNGSAVRQRLEKLKMLKASEVKRGADAAVLAAKWTPVPKAPVAPETAPAPAAPTPPVA